EPKPLSSKISWINSTSCWRASPNSSRNVEFLFRGRTGLGQHQLLLPRLAAFDRHRNRPRYLLAANRAGKGRGIHSGRQPQILPHPSLIRSLGNFHSVVKQRNREFPAIQLTQVLDGYE